MKNLNKELMQSLKIITLSLIIGLGVSIVYALDWTAPSCAPVGCNTYAPVNVGPDAQTKTGDLGAADVSAFTNGFISDGQTLITGAAGITSGLHVGVSGSSPSTDFFMYKYSSAGPDHATSYPAQACFFSDGSLQPCPAPSGTVDLTLSESSYNQQYTNVTAPSASRTATLTWTVPAGSSCVVGNQTETPASTVTGWPVGYTINSSGSASVTFTRYGASTITLTCDYGGGTPSDTVTYTYNGTDTFTSNGSFTGPTSVTSITFKAVGGGGGGAGHCSAGQDPLCSYIGNDGTNTTIDWTGGTTLDFTALKGTKALFCANGTGPAPKCGDAGYPTSYNGTGGSGNSTNGATVYNGSVTASGGSSIGLSSYGKGGDTGGRDGGGGAGISATKTITAGSVFNVTIGQGGNSAEGDEYPVEDGADGVVQFSW